MIFLLLLSSLILITNQNLQAQQNQSIQAQYAIYDSIQIQEKVYVQTDRTLYQPGNKIWLNAFVVNSANCPSDLSREIYVELLDPKGSVLEVKILENKKGCGAGQLKLSIDAAGGIYTLRAYSYWMQNFDTKHYFEKKLTVQKVVLPDVLMQLDFEQEGYGAGSQVVASFKARTKDNKVFAQKKIDFEVFIEGKKLCRKTVETDAKGAAYLVFQLPTESKTNDVLLNVQLSQDSIQESIARMVPIVLNNLDIQFLPEGGNLVANKVNRVAFKVLNEYGKPVDIQAELLDENQNSIATLESYHQGMGAFEFVPQENVSYQVQLLRPSGIQKKWILPKASSQSIGLYLKAQDKTQLVLDIYNNNQALELVAQQQGKLFYTQKIAPEEGTQSYIISTKNLPMGVVQLTVFDNLKRALCERLVFVNKERKLSLILESDKESYLPREAVKLSLQATDETGKGVVGNFALAVVNDKEHTFIDDKQDNILSYLLMSSDLQGKVYEPDFYFDPTEPKADTALDYVLLTHGWRRYDWNKVVHQDSELWADSIDFIIQSNEISGYLKINHYLKGQQQILLSEKRPVYRKKKALMTAVTNADGFFKFKRKGLKFPVFLTFRHQGLPRTVKVTEYSKAGLELIRKVDLKKAVPPKSTKSKKDNYTKTNLNQGKLYGVIWDSYNDEGLPFANVVLEKNGIQIEGTQTDFDGNYSFDSIGAGTYDLLVAYVGYKTILTQGVPIKNSYKLELDIELTEGDAWNYNRLLSEEFILIDGRKAEQYRKRLTEKEDFSISHPHRNPPGVEVSTATINQAEGGMRTTNNLMLVDGIGVFRGNMSIRNLEIEEIQILTSGVPAAFENQQSLNANGSLIEPDILARSYESGKRQEMVVRSYRIPLIDQSNTMGGQTLSSADIVPGGGWGGGYSERSNYSSPRFEYDKVDFQQVGKGIEFSPKIEFYVPQYQAEKQVDVRTDFRKTIYWNPSVQTNENGRATIQYHNSDEVTTFRAIVEGGTSTGVLGRVEHT
ncbi:MAG: carboxypeptidase-like regulatory domain-containing protein, partial [Aureispira sp.]|nr:carboxypeptidase-like regulatory domain-containing protein [Aureispira sp.]